jgi:hypothetical protein
MGDTDVVVMGAGHADPWRQPLAALATLFSPVRTLADKWRMALSEGGVVLASGERVAAGA